MTKSERETLRIIHRYLEDGYGYLSDGRVGPGIERTEQQSTRLELLRLVMNDTAAAQAAIEFVGDDPLKLELFKDQYKLATTEREVVARTFKAIQDAKEALTLFG